MDPGDVTLFERSLGDATRRSTGADLDAALDDLGWPDALGLADGSTTVLPAVGGWTPPGTVDARWLRVDGLAPATLAGRPTALVVASTSGGATVACTVPTASLDLHPVTGVDPDMGLVRVNGEIAAIGSQAVPADAWPAAHELIGASRTMLDLACDHARGRIQFDRPIASFQAVRHRLAEALVAVAMAEAMLEAAWLDPTPDASAMAKAVAGRQAKTTARHCQQVLAGIGFTVEHPFHRYVRRTLALDALLGTATSLTTALGVDLVDRRRLPPLLPL